MNYLEQIASWSNDSIATFQKTTSIDSTRIRIPLFNCDLSELFTDDFYKVSIATSDILSEHKASKSFTHTDKGINTRYDIKTLRTGRDTGEFLCVSIHSKHRKKDYFGGVSKDSLEQIYNDIQKQKVARFSLESFLNAECTDTDFKQDFTPNCDCKRLVKELRENARFVKESRKGLASYERKDNTGIQYALRSTDSVKYPYLKLYEKVRELIYNSSEFYTSNLPHFRDGSQLMRVEATVKNKKHFKLLGCENTTLLNLVNESRAIADKAFQRAFDAHIEQKEMIKEQKDLSGLKLRDKALLNLVKMQLPFSHSCEALIERIIRETCKTKQERYKLRTDLREIVKYL